MTLPKLYGVIGWPIKHSLSPAMHNAAFKKLGIDAEYKLFEVPPEKLEDFILNRKDVAGFNITVPHKIRAKDIADKNFPRNERGEFIEQDLYYVKLTGAINTVKREGDGFKYWNTDASGFLKALKEDLKIDIYDAKGGIKNMFLIGCGGAGRAIVAASSWKQSKIKKIYVHDINQNSIDSAKRHFSNLPPEWNNILGTKLEFITENDIEDRIKKSQLLVNASPVGMQEGDNSPVDKKLLHNDLCVYDIVYNRETQLVKDARFLLGKDRAAGGLDMLLYQGAAAFEFWTGQKAPIDAMRTVLNKALSLKLTPRLRSGQAD